MKYILSIAVIISGLVIAGTIIFFSPQEEEQISSETLSTEEAGEEAMSFINEVMLQGQLTASLLDVSEEYGLYRLDLSIDGQDYSSYITKDGKFFFAEKIDIEEAKSFMEEGTASAPLPDVDLEGFVSCLEEENFVIYGEASCPYCQEVVETLGGKNVAAPVYVECSEEVDLCKEKEISAYPTILIDGQSYKGNRSLESFALETGCSLE